MKWQCCPLDPGIERALRVAELDTMAGRKSADPSPESIARADRQRLAAEEGARARADVEQKAIAVRKNMERLRELRLAKEAHEPGGSVQNRGDAKKRVRGAPKTS